MAVLLAGGCRVWTMREEAPRIDGSLISMRVLQCEPGTSTDFRNEEFDEVLYVLDECTVVIDDAAHPVEPQSGVFIPAKTTFRFENRGQDPARFVSVQSPSTDSPPALSVVRLADQRAMPTADRWYRVVIDAEVTQFVGSIPPGRAPDHFHEYEEVLFILNGEGRMWAGDENTPIAAGSCIYLPRRQVHCVENAGTGELRLLGVFYPAGSPAVRYETATQNP